VRYLTHSLLLEYYVGYLILWRESTLQINVTKVIHAEDNNVIVEEVLHQENIHPNIN
jgi:hypothetical protein